MRFILWKFQDIYIDEVCRFFPPYLYNLKSINAEFGIKDSIISKENKL